jgi:hypothetical protein
MSYPVGRTANLRATFLNRAGELADPDEVTVSVFDPTETPVVVDAIPVRESVGRFRYDLDLAADDPLGQWHIDWHALIDDLVADGREDFAVTLYAEIESDAANENLLRSRLGEVSKLPYSEQGSDTIFSTAEITEILARFPGDLDSATLEGWERKSARMSNLVDVAESGAQRTMTDKFKQAKQMCDFWRNVVHQGANMRAAAMSGRAVGKVLSLREPVTPTFAIGFQPYGLANGFGYSHDSLIVQAWGVRTHGVRG